MCVCVDLYPTNVCYFRWVCNILSIRMRREAGREAGREEEENDENGGQKKITKRTPGRKVSLVNL